MTKIFIDSSFIIAIFREIEPNHIIAINHMEQLFNKYECCISNAVISEITTILMMRTKDIILTENAYYFLKDNFTIVNEYEIPLFNDKVFNIFQKYNKTSYKLSFVDCAIAVICNYYNISDVVSFDKGFKLMNEINLIEL